LTVSSIAAFAKLWIDRRKALKYKEIESTGISPHHA
jgi:hypothetical protein